MKCPYCESPETSVIDSRPNRHGVRRRRRCDVCANRFSTQEILSGFDCPNCEALRDRILGAADAQRARLYALASEPSRRKPEEAA